MAKKTFVWVAFINKPNIMMIYMVANMYIIHIPRY